LCEEDRGWGGGGRYSLKSEAAPGGERDFEWLEMLALVSSIIIVLFLILENP